MRFRPWLAVALAAACLLSGCAGSRKAPEPTSAATTEITIWEPDAVIEIPTEPTTLPPATPPEEVLPEIETLVADTPNARVYIEDGTLCVDTFDEITTGTGSIAYDRIEGGAEAWKSVIARNVALCALIRTTMDNAGAYDTPAKVSVVDHRFDSRAILTIVDGEVVEDTVAIELAKAPVNHPKPSDSDDEYIAEDQEEMVWIPDRPGKYHRNKRCSGMKDPSYVKRSYAVSQGYGPCGNCYK